MRGAMHGSESKMTLLASGMRHAQADSSRHMGQNATQAGAGPWLPRCSLAQHLGRAFGAAAFAVLAIAGDAPALVGAGHATHRVRVAAENVAGCGTHQLRALVPHSC